MNCAITSANNFSGQSAVIWRIYPVQPSSAGGISEEIYPQQAVYFSHTFPISAFLPGGNLNVTVLSHGNRLDFGRMADKHALPDIAFVARAMEQSFAELDAAVLGPRRASGQPAAAKAKAGPRKKSAPTKKAMPKEESAQAKARDQAQSRPKARPVSKPKTAAKVRPKVRTK